MGQAEGLEFSFPTRPLRSGVSPKASRPHSNLSFPQLLLTLFRGVEPRPGKAWLYPGRGGAGSEAPFSENSAYQRSPGAPNLQLLDLPRHLVASSRSLDITLVPKHIYNTLTHAHAPKPSSGPSAGERSLRLRLRLSG